MGDELKLIDPEKGDYRPWIDSPAEAYGCQTFVDPEPALAKVPMGDKPANSPVGFVVSGEAVEVGGVITVDTTWDATLIRMVGSVEVASDVSLTITPGTRVESAGNYRLLVRGRLWAVGEPDNRIQFTAEVGQQTLGWDGIEFLNLSASNEPSRLEHCDISFAVAKAAASDDETRIFGGTARPETGGAISIVGVNNLVITSCVFTDNRADYGGAIYCGYGSSPVVSGNLFYNNTAAVGGSALFNVYAYPKLINNTIVGNECLAESSFHLCGAVDNFNGKILLSGNIIRDNATNHYSGTQLVASKDYYTNNNNIEAYEGNATNLDLDPEFLGAGEFPFQLDGSSCCIDGGIDSALLKMLPDHDIAGYDRVCGAGIDWGAFEYCGLVSAAPEIVPSRQKPTLTCIPNPFNPQTKIVFELPVDAQVSLKIYDLQGCLLRTLEQGARAAGQHESAWDGRDSQGRVLASGTYVYQLWAGEHLVARSMTLIR